MSHAIIDVIYGDIEAKKKKIILDSRNVNAVKTFPVLHFGTAFFIKQKIWFFLCQISGFSFVPFNFQARGTRTQGYSKG